VTNSRWGFPRVAGPYAHAILAGLMLVVGYRIHRWLEWSQQWEPRFRKVPWLGLSKAGILTLGLLGGIFMTLSRGPWLGGLLAGVVVMIGRTKNRWKTLAVASLLAVGLGLPAGFAVQEYVSVGRQGASSLTQETAAYRKEMVEKYLDIALEHSLWGWGTNGWPQIPGMPSIDNHYLLMALRYGFLSVSLFVLILATTSFRLFRMGMRQPPSNPPGSSLAFTLLSLYAVIGISITTVFLGVQTLPMLFLITGWAEGYLLLGEESVIVAPSQQASLPTFKFQRVLT
jgi:O-antigen ligase